MTEIEALVYAAPVDTALVDDNESTDSELDHEYSLPRIDGYSLPRDDGYSIPRDDGYSLQGDTLALSTDRPVHVRQIASASLVIAI